jgi:hypothetical protein
VLRHEADPALREHPLASIRIVLYIFLLPVAISMDYEYIHYHAREQITTSNAVSVEVPRRCRAWLDLDQEIWINSFRFMYVGSSVLPHAGVERVKREEGECGGSREKHVTQQMSETDLAAAWPFRSL